MLKKLLNIIQRDGLAYTTKRIVAFLIAHSPFAYKVSYLYYKNTRLTFSPSLLCYAIFASKKTRLGDIKMLEKFVNPGSVVIDVGANIGSLTIVASYLAGQNGRIIAFEPSPKFAHIVDQNIKINKFQDRAEIHQVALGANASTVYLNESVADDTTNHIADTGTAVPQNSLDSFTHELPHIDFLKIDVEGYELEVLKGASETLKKTDVLYIEFIPAQLERCGSDPRAVLDIITNHFTIHTIKNDVLVPFTYNPTDTHHPDLLCLKKQP